MNQFSTRPPPAQQARDANFAFLPYFFKNVIESSEPQARFLRRIPKEVGRLDARTFQREAMKLEQLLYHISVSMLRSGADCADAVQDALLRACAVPAAALMPRMSLPFWGSSVSMREDFPCRVRNDLAEIAVGDCHARIDEAVHDGMALYPRMDLIPWSISSGN